MAAAVTDRQSAWRFVGVPVCSAAPRLALFFVALWTAAVAAVSLPIQAQEIPSRDAPSRDASQALRDQLFAELARDVDALEQQLSIIKRVARLVSPTVVHIEAKKNSRYQHRFGTRADIEEAGSGVIVEFSEGKYVLTNRHVIRDSDEEDVKIHLHDGRILRPIWVREDKETDVAVMAIPDVGELIPARLGNSADVEIGDFVLAVGSPFGLSQSITYGIISAKGRYDLDLGDGEREVKYQNFLQTDAAINPGNSGGPLINLRGEVIGLNTAIASSSGGNEGIGFSIPINTALYISRQLVETGDVSRAFLGVGLDGSYNKTTRFAAEGTHHVQGARVNSITARSPAEEVDIRPGDVILVYDGVRIKDLEHLLNVVGLTEVGREVSVVILRDGQTRTVTVRVAPRPASEQ